ncbi:hypothetical protein EDD18DRAFT_1107936 [Armillaria luteobubalina]|uniref:Uncharacterized protein n=1 Tax=Armillaria luteobubalina TaxID=153913 RepID=A0AA39Q0U9_9AGAR|nr:hypothetical protein EDD18DRAFT_1107936 [Armillaria luteobubalina]
MSEHPNSQSTQCVPILPPELTDQIIDALSDDVKSLTQCTIASRQLANRSRYHLFRAIRFRFFWHWYKSYNRCETFPKKCHGAAPLVKSLTLSEECLWYSGPEPTPWVASEPQLPIALGLMVNLTSLRLVKVKIVDIDITWPGVEELEINDCFVRKLGTFLGGFHKLRKLKMRGVSILDEETSPPPGVSVDLEELVISGTNAANAVQCLLPLFPQPFRIRRLTYPFLNPEYEIPQHDIVPYTHLDDLFLEGANNTDVPVPDIRNVTKLRLFVISPQRWDPTDACKACDELIDWLIHLLYKAQGGCLKEVQLEYSLHHISGSPDKFAELDQFLAKMELKKVELVFSATPDVWEICEYEEANWPWDGDLQILMKKYTGYFAEVKKQGLLTVSRRDREECYFWK